MSKTNIDWGFSTYIHFHIAIPEIYNKLNWEPVALDKEEATKLDIYYGIDYVFKDKDERHIYVQERFRDNYYGDKFNDATLRFRRDSNPNPDRTESEFYKIKADYLVYGICNGSKYDKEKITGFTKWAILDIGFIKEKYQQGKLIIGYTGNRMCKQDKDTMICPENFNPDGSSSFLPFDLGIMKALWGDAPVYKQKGFI